MATVARQLFVLISVNQKLRRKEATEQPHANDAPFSNFCVPSSLFFLAWWKMPIKTVPTPRYPNGQSSPVSVFILVFNTWLCCTWHHYFLQRWLIAIKLKWVCGFWNSCNKVSPNLLGKIMRTWTRWNNCWVIGREAWMPLWLCVYMCRYAGTVGIVFRCSVSSRLPFNVYLYRFRKRSLLL